MIHYFGNLVMLPVCRRWSCFISQCFFCFYFLRVSVWRGLTILLSICTQKWQCTKNLVPRLPHLPTLQALCGWTKMWSVFESWVCTCFGEQHVRLLIGVLFIWINSTAGWLGLEFETWFCHSRAVGSCIKDLSSLNPKLLSSKKRKGMTVFCPGKRVSGVY